MGAFSMALSNIAHLKSLEDEIVDVLRASPAPITSAQILGGIANPPDRETLTREVFRLAVAGVIVKVGDCPAPPGVPRKTVATYALPSAIAKQIAAEIPNNETEQENPMPTQREAAAEQLAHSLHVKKAIPARRSKSMARSPKVVDILPPKGVRPRGRQDRLISILAERSPEAMTVDALARMFPDASHSAINQACLKAARKGLIQRVKLEGGVRAFRLPVETKAGKCETKPRQSGTKTRKSVTPPRVAAPEKLQRKTAKVQPRAAKAASAGALPAVPDSAYPPGAMPLKTSGFRCGVFSDGSMMIAGDFEMVTSSGVTTAVTLPSEDVLALREYLRRLNMPEAAQ